MGEVDSSEVSMPPAPASGLTPIVIIGIGSWGDYLPAREIARALHKLGHPVACISHAHHKQDLQDSGIQFVEFPDSIGWKTEARPLPKWIERSQTLNTIVRRWWRRPLHYRQTKFIYDTLCRLHQSGWKLVIGTDWNLGFREFAEQHPEAVFHYTVTPAAVFSSHAGSGIPEPRLPQALRVPYRKLYWLASDVFYWAAVGSSRNRLRREAGLSRRFRHRTRWNRYYGTTLAMFSEWYVPRQPDWPELTYAGFVLPEALLNPEGDGQQKNTEILSSLQKTPTVAFICGNHCQLIPQFFQLAIEYSQATNTQVLLLGGEDHPQPGNRRVIWRKFSPLGHLLPHCAAVVHHGGVGTTVQTILSGTPQIIRPFLFDQFAQALRVEQLGVGRRLLPHQWDLPHLREALRELLDPSIQDALQRLQQAEQNSTPIETAVAMIQKKLGAMESDRKRNAGAML